MIVQGQSTQAQSESLFHWLYTNPPAAWITAVAAVVTLVVLLVRRQRPRRLVMRELPSVSFLSVDPAMHHRICNDIRWSTDQHSRCCGFIPESLVRNFRARRAFLISEVCEL